MNDISIVLIITAASIGFFHTLFGPDHYLPFIMMAKARKWSLLKTSLITSLCGLGHVVSSIVLGFFGVAFGVYVAKLEAIESVRGNVAAWLLIAFGCAYLVWGIRQAVKNNPHKHWHQHEDGSTHVHEHTHVKHHAHVHRGTAKKSITPWVLFTIFVFGPCEPLIPILMYPAAKLSMVNLILVTSVFSIVTIGTMLGVVLLTSYGMNFVKLGRFERYIHSVAGAIILLSGLGIQFLGL